MAGPLRNIAFIGASGYLGRPTLEALAERGHHNITVISRTSSTSQIPHYEGVTVRAGEYDDESFMQSVLQHQDVLIIMLAFLALPQQSLIIRAAANAGVKYVIPSEYMMDSSNTAVCDAVPLMQKCRRDHETIQQHGMKFITVVCNLWLDFTLARGMADIDWAERKAIICEDSAPFCTTTTTKVAKGIAAMLALPRIEIDERFSDSYLYLSSFRITHDELFRAVLRATDTEESDWSVKRQSCRDLLEQGRSKLAAHDRSGMIDLFVGSMFDPSLGADYSEKSHNQMLQLAEEDLERTIRNVINGVKERVAGEAKASAEVSQKTVVHEEAHRRPTQTVAS